ncbi:sugar phosphate isomerase/epimerase family protein [Haladaptatus sp. NG-SE-30]
MVRTSIQLYSLRDLDTPLPDLIRDVGETTFDGVEFAGFGDSDPSDVTEALDDAGLDATAAHVGTEELETSFSETVARYREVGCETLVVPYLDESHFESYEAVEETADRLSELAERAVAEGCTLCYHNHDHEFTSLDGRTAFDVLVESSDDSLEFELDLGWIDAAGHDPTTLLDELRDRVSLVHVKDVRATDRVPVELGDGDLDVRECMRAVRDADVQWLIYEHDQPEDPVRSLEHGARTLDELRTEFF